MVSCQRRRIHTCLPKGHDFLKGKYEFHCAILYGSRAGNDFRPDSDYDLLCVSNGGPRIREIIKFENATIDLIVDDESALKTQQPIVYLWQSKIIVDDKGFAKSLVDTALKILAEPPQPLSSSRIAQRKKQTTDILHYIQRPNILGDYRRHDLFPKLLGLYLAFNRMWDLGDKHSFQWMEKNDPHAFNLFHKAMLSDAAFSDIEALVNHINSL